MRAIGIMSAVTAMGITPFEVERRIANRDIYEAGIKAQRVDRPKAKAQRKARRIERKNRK